MEKNRGSKGSPMIDPRALMEEYQRSLEAVEYDSDAARTERAIQMIKDKNRRRGQSIWTEQPVVKPEKSVWMSGEQQDQPVPVRTQPRRRPVTERRAQRPVRPVRAEGAKPSDDVFAGVRVAADHKAEQERAEREKLEREQAARRVETPKAPAKKLIDKPKTELTLEVTPKGTSIRSASRQTVTLGVPAAVMKREDKPAPEPKPVPKPVTAARQEISVEVPKAVIKEEAVKAAPVTRQQEPAVKTAQEAEQEKLREELLPFAGFEEQGEEEAAASDTLQSEPEPQTELSDPVPVPASEPAPKVERSRIEVSEKQFKTDLEKYEKLREKTIKKQKERERLSKTGRNDFEFSFVNAAVCLTVMMTVAIALVVMHRESGFINSEFRNLATFPKFSLSSWFDGSFAKGVTTYYTDTIPYREDLKKMSASITDKFGIKSDDIKVKGKMKTVKKEKLDEEKVATTTTVTAFTGKVTTTTTKKDETTTTTTTKKTEKEEIVEVPDNLDDVNWEGNVIVVGSGKNVRAVDAYYGSFEIGEQYAECVNKWKADLGDSVNVYNMTIPTAAAYYLPEKFRDNVSDQKDNITNIYANLKGVIGVDIYDILDDHKKEYIYSRTDHHWQPLGAYYAMKVFSEKAGIEYPELSTYEECKIEDFVGTMYGFSDYEPQLAEYPDTFIYYKPDNEYTVKYYDTSFENPVESGLFFDFAEGVNCYSAILNVDAEIAEIETDCDNGRVLVIFKDSFGNATVPFLTHGFSKIYVCDYRYFDLNAIDFCKQVGCTDLMFALSITSASTDFKIDQLNNIRIQ